MVAIGDYVIVASGRDEGKVGKLVAVAPVIQIGTRRINYCVDVPRDRRVWCDKIADLSGEEIRNG